MIRRGEAKVSSTVVLNAAVAATTMHRRRRMVGRNLNLPSQGRINALELSKRATISTHRVRRLYPLGRYVGSLVCLF